MEAEDILSDIGYKAHLSVPCPQTNATPYRVLLRGEVSGKQINLYKIMRLEYL